MRACGCNECDELGMRDLTDFEERILSKINEGNEKGEMPSGEDLAQSLRLPITVVGKAIHFLIAEGLIEMPTQ